MEILENKEILEYYGIYQKRELTDKEKDKYLKLKEEIEKSIETPIEKMYLVGQNAWGNLQDNKKSKDTIYIVLDKRFKDLEKEEQLLQKYSDEKNIGFLLTSLCWHEKRKNIPTEQEYFIVRYGIEIYNSGKEPSTNETIKGTQYAVMMSNLKSLKPYIGTPMESLVPIYILKLGMPINKRKSDFEKEIKIVKMISKDERAIELIDEYLKEKNKNKQKEISKEFEKIVKETKQVKYEAKLKNKPSMEIYEKLLKEKGKLDIKNLTKEELYIMYVTQGKQTSEIADLYGVEIEKIDRKRKHFNIKLREHTISPENIEKLINKLNNYKKYTYATLKNMILSFEKCIIPILDYMKDGDTYLLREFWKFCKKDENSMLDNLVCKDENAYYKAELSVDFLIQNKLIKEVEYKQYKITSEGKKLLKHMWRYDIDKIDIPIISKYLPEFKYFGMEYKKGYPTSIEEIQVRFKELKEKMHNEIEKYYDKEIKEEETPEITEWILAFLNTIFEDKNTPQRVKTTEDIEDLRYMLHEEFEKTETEIKITLKQNIISSEIYKYIEQVKISDIIKFAISNYIKFNKNIENIKIEKIGE